MWQKVAEGMGFNLAAVVGYEGEVAEGQRAKLTLNLRSPLDPYWGGQLQQQLDSHGVTEAEVAAYGDNVDITYRKGFPWLAVIVAIVLGLIVLAILIVSWQFYKEAPVTFSILAVAVLAAVAGVGIYLARREV